MPGRTQRKRILAPAGIGAKALTAEALLAEIDSNRGQDAGLQFQVDQSLDSIARYGAAIFLGPQFSEAHLAAVTVGAAFPAALQNLLQSVPHLRAGQRPVKNAIGARLKGLARPRIFFGDGQDHRLPRRREQ